MTSCGLLKLQMVFRFSAFLLGILCCSALVTALPQHQKCGIDGYNVKPLRDGEKCVKHPLYDI